MTRQELIHRVKVKLEELSPYGYEAPLIAVYEDSELTENINKEIKPIISYIAECLTESCNTILSILPLHLIKPKEFEVKKRDKVDIISRAYSYTGGRGYFAYKLEMPSDFLRLHSFKFKDWEKVVQKTISPESPLYVYECNDCTMGKPTRPVCIVERGYDNVTILTTNSTSLSDHLTPLQDLIDIRNYVARFDDTDIQDSLTDFFVLQTAIDVCKILGLTMREQLEEELKVLIQSNQY